MSALAKIQYVSDEAGKPTGVIIPIDFWREVFADQVAERDEPGQVSASARHEALRSLLSFSGQIAASWRSSKSAVDLVDEQRR